MPNIIVMYMKTIFIRSYPVTIYQSIYMYIYTYGNIKQDPAMSSKQDRT